jgi:Flp pilus assembly protein TadB
LQKRSTWEALLVAILPGRFDPDQAKTIADVISLLRRAGYPYDTPGEFYAVAIRDFSIFLGVGGLLAGALVAMNILMAAPVVALIFIFLGLRRPYVRLKTMAKKRAEGLRNNMLIGLSVLGSLLSSGVGVQEALRRTSSVGGPFCNLLGLLVARMEVEDFTKAIEVTRAHLPDPSDVEAGLFLRDIHDFFANNRPVLSSVQGLQESVHRSVVESTEARAALVRQRAGLFGVMAVLGLVLAIIAPFMGAGLM